MRRAKVSRNKAAGCALAIIVFVIGVVLFFTIPILGWAAGPVLCVFGIAIALRSEKVWRCTECRAIVPRG